MKKKGVLHSSLSNFLFGRQGVVQMHGAKATKKLGAGGGAYLAGLLHVFVYTMV